MTDNIMLRECAITVIIKTEEPKNLGNVNIKNCMPMVSVKTATLTNTIK